MVEELRSLNTSLYGNCTDKKANTTGFLKATMLDIDVVEGDLIVVEVNECTTEDNHMVCPFLPVMQADEKSCIQTIVNGSELQTECGLLFNLKADIQPYDPTPTQSSTDAAPDPPAILFLIIVLSGVVTSLALGCTFYTRWRMKKNTWKGPKALSESLLEAQNDQDVDTSHASTPNVVCA
jgi:hypothetical protein